MIRWGAMALPLTAAVLAACGGGSYSIDRAIDDPPDGPVDVGGALFLEGDTVLLCKMIESDPPQCGGDSLTVERLDLNSVVLARVFGAVWGGGLTLHGRVDGHTIIVTEQPGIRDESGDDPRSPSDVLRRGRDQTRIRLRGFVGVDREQFYLCGERSPEREACLGNRIKVLGADLTGREGNEVTVEGVVVTNYLVVTDGG